MPKKFDVVTIGDCQLDYFLVPSEYSLAKGLKNAGPLLQFKLSQKIPVSEFKVFQGGNALNTAVSFSRLGLKVAILAELGRDEGAQIILKKVRQEHINESLIFQDGKVETDKSVVIVTEGERTILTYHCKKSYKFPPDIRAKWFYLTSLGAGYEKMYQQVISFIKGHKVKLVYNPGTRQLLHAVAAVRKMAKLATLLFVNLEEARRITGEIKGGNVKRSLIRLRALGARTVMVTDGVRGAYAFDGINYLHIGSFPARRVDATGAGDAFASGCTAALIHGLDLAEALRWGSVNAASEISQVGVQNGLLRKSRLGLVLKRHPGFRARRF